MACNEQVCDRRFLHNYLVAFRAHASVRDHEGSAGDFCSLERNEEAEQLWRTSGNKLPKKRRADEREEFKFAAAR